MFIGHFAVGFAAKRAAPRASLGALVAAPIALDLLWPVFLLLGWERVRIDPGNTAFTPLDFVSYPITHSLLTALGWAMLFGSVYYWRTRYRPGAVWVGVGVVSHWLLDAVVHRPDLPLYPGGDLRAGMGLWNSIIGTILLEGAVFALGVWLYARQTRPIDWKGSYGFGSFVALLVVIYLGNAFGPPPPGVTAIAVAGLLGGGLSVLWAGWFDRHRKPLSG